MPAFVRTEKDEARWAEAKKVARGEGKADNYAYITSIYNRMKKGFGVAPMPQVAGAGTPYNHGHVPGVTATRRPSIARDIDPERMPKPKTPMEMKLPVGPFNSPDDAVRGMGFTPSATSTWSRVLSDVTTQSADELRFKQNLMGKLLENFADDPTMRREMYQRGLAYFRTVGKPQVTALTLKAIDRRRSVTAAGLTRESRESASRGGHKLELHGRKDPVQEVQQQTNRTLPAGTIRVHYSAEKKGYVRAMKRNDGTWKLVGDAHPKKEPKGKPDHTKPKLVVHHDEHRGGSHEPHHDAEDGHNEAREHVLAMKSQRLTVTKRMTEAGPITTLYRADRKGPFADEKNKKYPIDDYEHTRAAISYFSMPKNARKYAPSERSAIWNRITAAARKFKIDLGPEAGPPSLEAKKSTQSKEIEMDSNEVFKAILDRDVDKDVEVSRPNDYQSEFTGMPEEALSETKTEEIGDPAATAAGAEEGNPETESPMAPGAGSGDADGLGGATDDDSPGLMEKGEPHPNHVHGLRVAPQDGEAWTQGKDSRVMYSSSEDSRIAAAMEKSDSLCVGPEPSIRHTLTRGSKENACGHIFAKALTVCPDCGTDSSGFRGQVQGLSISKSVETSLAPPASLPSIHLVD